MVLVINLWSVSFSLQGRQGEEEVEDVGGTQMLHTFQTEKLTNPVYHKSKLEHVLCFF